MREKNENYTGISLSLGVCLLCVMVFCFLPVQADYWAGFSENGQYQVTFTPKADGSATIQGVAVGPGGSITPLGNPTTSGDSYGEYADTGVTQNLVLTGPSGWAEVIAQDANDNEAHAEVNFTEASGEGCVVVHQYAGPITPSQNTELYGTIEPVVTGVEAGQCVWSDDFSWIEALSYSFNGDDSTAAVKAEATSGNSQSSSFGRSDGGGSSLFSVTQGTGAFTPVTDGPEQVNTYSSDSKFDYELPTYAYQYGLIKNAETADVAAGSSIPQGFSTLISGSVVNGNLIFDLDAAAGQNPSSGFSIPGTSSYRTTACGNILVSGQSGTASAISTGPEGQYAKVIAPFTKNLPTIIPMNYQLSASGYTDDGGFKICTENRIVRLSNRYSGNVTASNSEDPSGKTAPSSRSYGGKAWLTSGDQGTKVWR